MSKKEDISALSGHLTSLVTTIKRRATRTLTENTGGTSVKSTIGYQRWTTGGGDEEQRAGGDGIQEESIRLSTQYEPEIQGDNCSSDGELSSAATSPTSEGAPEQNMEAEDSSDSEELREPATSKTDTITEWQAGWNVTNAIQGMFIVSFPYTVQQGGYWSLIAMIVVAYICCYTGKILVACLYEEQKDGGLLRVRTSYSDIAERVFGARFGKPIVNIAQVIELLMTCILYVLLCGDLLKGSFNVEVMPLSAWITISTLPLLLCAFIKTMRRVSWLSLWCSVAHMLINVIIIIYCFILVKQWQPKAVTIKPDIGTVPIAMGIIVFSYTSQIFLPTLEGKMVRRDKFHCMLHWTHIAAAIFKALFSYIGFVTFGEATEELITNNLPSTLRVIVNIILVIKALLSYPLPYFAAVDIIENVFFQDQAKTLFTSCYKEDMSIKWWGYILRLLLVLVTMLMAIFIPHFAILMGLIGSFTGTMLSFVWPCIFHLYLKRDTIRWYQKGLDIFIIALGVLCGTMGIYSASRALVIAIKANHPASTNLLSAISDKAVNETLKSRLLG